MNSKITQNGKLVRPTWNYVGEPGNRGTGIDTLEMIESLRNACEDVAAQLVTLNNLLHCSNFTGIPATLREIQQNTKQKRRVKNVEQKENHS